MVQRNMVRDALKAFLTVDANAARSVRKRDEVLDNFNHEFFKVLDSAMTHGTEGHRNALDILLVAQAGTCG